MTPDHHIATLVVLSVALVQSQDEHNMRAQQELFTTLLATARALPRETVDAMIKMVGAPVVEVEDLVVRPIEAKEQP